MIQNFDLLMILHNYLKLYNNNFLNKIHSKGTKEL